MDAIKYDTYEEPSTALASRDLEKYLDMGNSGYIFTQDILYAYCSGIDAMSLTEKFVFFYAGKLSYPAIFRHSCLDKKMHLYSDWESRLKNTINYSVNVVLSLHGM